jgi:hypothetical protein
MNSLRAVDDLVHLPLLHNTPSNTDAQSHLAAETPTRGISEGARNKSLWEHCMRQAHHCDDLDALLDVARTCNASFLPPLTDGEVVKIADSAWGYTQWGENRFGRPGVFFSTEEANRLITSDPDQFVLLAFLRANNGPNSNFMVANGLASKLRWGRNRFRVARRGLEETHIKMVTRPSTTNGPARYRWLAKAGRK